MKTNPYDYSTRNGIRPVSWEDFHGLCKALALAASRFQPEMIVAIGRGGYYPGTLLAHLLQVELYPARVSRRIEDVVRFASPRWLIEPPQLVAGRRVLIVDEICDSGETIAMVAERVRAIGAAAVKSAVLYAHTRSVSAPDYIGWVTDALVLNPWDREILRDGTFQFHPEYVQALALQGVSADSSLCIDVPALKLDKEDDRG